MRTLKPLRPKIEENPVPGQFVAFDSPVAIPSADGTKSTSYTGFLLRNIIIDPARKRILACTSVKTVPVWQGDEYDAHTVATVADIIAAVKPLILAALTK